MSVIDAAVRYVEGDGLSVIPLRPGSKRPAIDSWEPYQHRKPTRDELLRWFENTENNVGIVTGEISGIVVVDLDGDEGERSYNALGWPVDSRMAVTWSSGVHVYFTHPGRRVRNRAGLRPGLDMRGDGGYAGAAPSRVRGCTGCGKYHEKCKCEAPVWDFGTYEWLTPVLPLLPLPRNPDRKSKPRLAPPEHSATASRYVQVALEREVVAVATATEGTRNDQLNRSAFAIARFVKAGKLTAAQVAAAFVDAARRAGLPEHEADRTVESALRGALS